MYLTGRSPYLDSSLLCSNYWNIIGVIPLGNHSTAETVRSLYLSILPSPSIESTVLIVQGSVIYTIQKINQEKYSQKISNRLAIILEVMLEDIQRTISNYLEEYYLKAWPYKHTQRRQLLKASVWLLRYKKNKTIVQYNR